MADELAKVPLHVIDWASKIQAVLFSGMGWRLSEHGNR